MMAAIYENSALTIAAICCSESEDGLFRVLPPAAHERLFTHLNGEPIYVRRVPPKTPWAAEPGAGHLPLLQRGWVYQERILSPRVLHFTDEELVWECMESSRRETSQHGCCEPGRWRNAKADADGLDWVEIINSYSALDLTIRTDRLPALAGIARAYGAANDLQQYVAGHWAETIGENLCWRAQLPSRRREEKPKVPSWSWVAADGPVLAGYLDPEASPITVYGIEITASSGNPFLDPNPDCKIHLSAPLMPGTLLYSPKPGAVDKMLCWIRFGGEEETLVYPDYLLHEHSYSHVSTRTEVFCLFYDEPTPGIFCGGLVLRKVGSGLDEYERIGSVDCSPAFDINSTPMTNITLV